MRLENEGEGISNSENNKDLVQQTPEERLLSLAEQNLGFSETSEMRDLRRRISEWKGKMIPS